MKEGDEEKGDEKKDEEVKEGGEKTEEEIEEEENEEMRMCTRCLDVGEDVHNSMDCDKEEIINAGYKLGFC